ncbi:MAG TPA: TonB-dependent receptor [Nitrospirota bacterium]|nr:TonB-dependent receptor [Nitrospirota bacterium]
MKRVLCILCILTFCSFTSAVFADDTAERLKKLEDTVQEQSQTIDQLAETQKREIPGIFNPAIGFVGETIFSYRSQGPAETGSDRPGGFDIFQRSVELNAAASVDPFAKAYVVINASADPVTGESALTVEEAALQTTSLPGNLEVKAGRFFGEFGRLEYIHDHELPFVNRPLALDQYIGGESRTDGLQINWLVPVEHYISLTLGVGDQFGGDNPPNFVGETRHGSGLNYWGRLSTYFDLTPNISLEPGISGLWNPRTVAQWDPALNASGSNPFPMVDGNTYTERERRLAGVDLVLSWKPLRNNQFQTITWGTEVLYSDNRYDIMDPLGNALPGVTVGSYGLYSYVTYKFHRQWTAGVQYEWMEDMANKQAKTSAYSANLTWALSHWNQLRLQYTYTDPNAATGFQSDNAVYLQWAWIIGSHAHGWQQR